MRNFAVGLMTLLLIFMGAAIRPRRTAIGNAAARANVQPMTVRGAIWDDVCAKEGSHGKMMAKLQAKAVKECTLDCLAHGAQLVLYNLDDKMIFRVDSQDKVKEYAGQAVTASGTYDSSTGILHIESIDSLPQ